MLKGKNEPSFFLFILPFTYNQMIKFEKIFNIVTYWFGGMHRIGGSSMRRLFGISLEIMGYPGFQSNDFEKKK